MSDFKKNLVLLFERPREPLFMPKGARKVVFDVRDDRLTPRLQLMAASIKSRFAEAAGEHVRLKEISLPPLGEILELDRDSYFSLFLPKHRRIAGKLIDIFMEMATGEDFLAAAANVRDEVNPYLFNYALSVALLHRPDTEDINPPTLIGSFPEKFMDAKVFAQAREQAALVPEESRTPLEITETNTTATGLEMEHRLAYFREDLGINLHHWHWHVVYPYNGKEKIVAKDRRGELFYYMHRQIIARYNFERFCNKLIRVARFNDFKQPIEEGYFPKLDSSVASVSYPGRVANQRLHDLNREVDEFRQDVDDLKRWSDRIFGAIYQGIVIDECGCHIKLTENEGIDILGNMVESSILSPNRAFYGDLHNMGHVFISSIHDPDYRHLENLGVMGDTATAMRDPVFYKWHAFVDDMFQQYKGTLPPYHEDQLKYPGVTISDVEVQSQEGPKNTFNTFWQKSNIDLSKGMDFHAKGSIYVRFKHLQHQPFTYKIVVNNEGNRKRRGTCRILLAPKFNEKGRPWVLKDQKNMFIELDKFTVNLNRGQNTITRASTQSTVTIPFERTFYNLDENVPERNDLARFCGCGWPIHMLIPKGTPEGFPCELFVMVSNFEDDTIKRCYKGSCHDDGDDYGDGDDYDAGSYCGIRNKLYPDRRSMGYPFDRIPKKGINEIPTLQEFLTPNMKVRDVAIKFSDEIVEA